MKNQKNERGITLVALVVTIVVLLILAGITIMYVMGDNSVFSNANKASANTKEATVREAVMLSINANVIPQLYITTPRADNDYTTEFRNGLYSGMEFTGTVTAKATETASGEAKTEVTVDGTVTLDEVEYTVKYDSKTTEGLKVTGPTK